MTTRWLKCPGCDGEIGVPEDYDEEHVVCLKCSTQVAINPETSIQYRPARPAVPDAENDESQPKSSGKDRGECPRGIMVEHREWFLPAGGLSLVLAAVSFIASVFVGGGGTPEGAILAVLLNPLVWLGMILGFYWIHRSTDAGVFRCPACNSKCGTINIERVNTQGLPQGLPPNQRRCSRCKTVFRFKD